ncbi:MAG: hypothetical protein ACFFEN_10720 [Candidatus Thorarchaeota archaeon]
MKITERNHIVLTASKFGQYMEILPMKRTSAMNVERTILQRCFIFFVMNVITNNLQYSE